MEYILISRFFFQFLRAKTIEGEHNGCTARPDAPGRNESEYYEKFSQLEFGREKLILRGFFWSKKITQINF